MKLIQILDISEPSHIKPGMILCPMPNTDLQFLITRPAMTGEPTLREGKIVILDNRRENKFWAILLSHPMMNPELICVDLVFDPNTFKIYQIEAMATGPETEKTE